MSLAKDLADLSEQLGHFYMLKSGRSVIPAEEEFDTILSEGVRSLQDETPGTTLRIGRLIIERLDTGYDVYIHVGQYE